MHIQLEQSYLPTAANHVLLVLRKTAAVILTRAVTSCDGPRLSTVPPSAVEILQCPVQSTALGLPHPR